jgi:Domain of unknown function (DUF1905)
MPARAASTRRRHDQPGARSRRGRPFLIDSPAPVVVVDFDAELWTWDARRTDSRVFVSLPVEASDEIREQVDGPRRGFGSMRVRVTLGGSMWTTSIFPGSARGTYVLPIKRAIRKTEALDAADIATVTVALIGF